MRVLVTGAAGFIGSHLAERLLERGDTVVGIDCLLPDSYSASVKSERWERLRTRDRFEAIEGDLRHVDLRAALSGVDVVVNEAAMTGLSRCWEDSQVYTDCNVVALERLLGAARDVRLQRFVQISTSSVYGEQAIGDESTPVNPVSPYGATKLAAEQLVHDYSAHHGVPGIVLRYFSVYGPRQRPDMAYHRFCEALLNREPLVVYGDGTQTRSNTFVSDCVEGTVLAVDGGRVGETYNIAGAESIALIDAIAVLAEEFETRPVIDWRPPRPGDQLHTAGDARKAAREFGYSPKVAPREGLARQARWHLSRRAQLSRS
jgi:nucleoside-diphosphate-sugar epimerase